MYLKEIVVSTRNWVDSAHDRDYWGALTNEALNLQETYRKRPLRKPRRRWEDNIIMYLK